jgi:hypothetical protein
MLTKEFTLFTMDVKALRIALIRMMNNCISNLDCFQTKREKMILIFMMKKMIPRSITLPWLPVRAPLKKKNPVRKLKTIARAGELGLRMNNRMIKILRYSRDQVVI